MKNPSEWLRSGADLSRALRDALSGRERYYQIAVVRDRQAQERIILVAYPALRQTQDDAIQIGVNQAVLVAGAAIDVAQAGHRIANRHRVARLDQIADNAAVRRKWVMNAAHRVARREHPDAADRLWRAVQHICPAQDVAQAADRRRGDDRID